jgi:hypothetical protein
VPVQRLEDVLELEADLGLVLLLEHVENFEAIARLGHLGSGSQADFAVAKGQVAYVPQV